MSKIISLKSLYEYDYSVKVINALKHRWTNQYKISFIGSPKQQNLLLLLNQCKCKYTLKNGLTYFADDGDIIYIPKNSEYSAEFYDAAIETYNSIGINFFIYDEDGEELYLDHDILIIKAQKSENYNSLFSKIAEYSTVAVRSPAKLKSIFYEIFSSLSYHFRHKNIRTQKFEIIKKGIQYLEENQDLNLSIKEIASLCNVSEIYFRKLFKLYSGMSPIEYKLNARLLKAKQYLEASNLNVREISELAGFSEPSYFCKVFKEKTGLTPKDYRAFNMQY